MRTTILSLTLLTLTLGLAGCGAAAAAFQEDTSWNPIDSRYETGQTWDDIDPVLLKTGAVVVFPLAGTARVEAGAQIVAFRRDNFELITGGVMTSDYGVGFDGALLKNGQPIGWVVYTPASVALMSTSGTALEVQVRDGMLHLVETDRSVPFAAEDRAPRNEHGVPAARP